MTVVTATDLKINLGKYLSMVRQEEEIAISKNGQIVARLTPYHHYESDALVGVLDGASLPEDFDGDYRKWMQEMRMDDYENID